MTFKEWRQQEGLTQEAAAERLGVHKAHVSRLERGERAPSLARAALIEKVTKGAVTMADLARTAREGA